MVAAWNFSFGLALLAFLELMKVDASCPAPISGSPTTITKASCATYSSTYEDGSLSFCNGLVDYPYYLPDGSSQVQMDGIAEESLAPSSNPQAALLLSILPATCSNQLKKTVCLAVFQRCEYVDLAFLNSYCGAGQYCGACGDVSSDPESYASVCRSLTDDSIAGTEAVNCAAGPGKVPGRGNIGWELAKTLSPATSGMTMQEFCAAQNLVWSEDAKSCLAAVPRSPCKGVCDKLWDMDPQTATCPLISGNWEDKLNDWVDNSEDPFVVEQAGDALARGTPAGTYARTSVSLLGTFGLAPDCNANAPPPADIYKLFSDDFTQTFAANPSLSVGGAIALSAAAIGAKTANKCNCVLDLVQPGESGLVESSTPGTEYKCDPTRPANYCTHLATVTSRCNSQSGSAEINSNVGVVGLTDEGMIDQCKKVVTDPANQPSDVTLQLMQAAFGLPSANAAKGVFFIPPAPGLPVLATGSMERNLCNMVDQSNPTKSYTGKNSYECAIATVKSAAELVPPFVRGACRTAFHDMLCNMAHMKLEVKHLCLLPDGEECILTNQTLAAVENKIPFVFALPRFPDRQLCTNFKKECANFLDAFVGEVGDAKRDLLEATFNCQGKIQSSCERNNRPSPWESTVWDCDGQFNILDQFPVSEQGIANINGLLAGLGTYVTDNNLDSSELTKVGISSTTNQTISAGSISPLETCACPAPLVVPDDPNAPVENPVVCCAQRCEGHMYSKGEFDSIVTVQKVFSILSIIGTSFIIATWSLFKVKRSQPLTLLFAIASFNISLAFIIPGYSSSDIRDVWCKDNTQPNTQADGGMCLFQSIWITFWVLCACSFWMVQGFDLFLRIVRNQRHLEHMTKYYHLFGWGLPIIILAIILGSNAGGYRQTFFWCFMAQLEDESLGTALDLGLFYGTIITIWFVGASLMMLVLYRIYQITSKTSGTAQVSNTTMKRLALYRTPVFFVLFFVYVWASIFAWRFDNETKKNAIRDSGEDWAVCLLTNFAAGIPDPATNPLANASLLVTKYGIPADSGCGETYPVGIKYPDYIYLMCVTGLQGVFIFIIFGAKIENFNLWKEKLGLTTKKYDTTADQDSSTKDKTAKPSILSNAMSSMFQPSSPQPKTNDSVGEQGGSAVMVNGLQSGKFMAVTEAESLQQKVKNNQVAAAYMAE